MKRILSLILCAVLLCGLIGTTAYADTKVMLEISNETALPGETVTVKFNLGLNPGLTGFTFKVVYDQDVLNFQKISKKILDEDGETLGSWSVDKTSFAQDQKVMWWLDTGDTYDGTTLFTLTFQVAEDAKGGTYPITIDFGQMGEFVGENAQRIAKADTEIVDGSVTVQGEEETIEDGYYLIGSLNGWSADNLTAAEKFEPNPSSANEFMLQHELAVGDSIKVVRVENGAIAGWYPEGTGNDYVVDEPHSGNVTIYFNPNYVDRWSSFGGHIWINAKETVELYGASVSLNGSIGLNFYLIPSQKLLDDANAYVTLTNTVTNNETRLPVAGAKTRVVGDYTLYQYVISLPAKEMSDKVEVKVFTGDGTVCRIHSMQQGETSESYQFAIQDYIAKTIDANADTKLVALVKAMSDYGSLAQVQFKHNLDNRAELWTDLSTVSAADLADYAAKVTEGAGTGATFKGSTLVLESETTLRFYFTVDEGEIGDYTVKVNGKAVTPVEKDGMWCAEVKNISAKNLDKTQTFLLSGPNGTIVTVKASALSYACSVLNNAESPESLVNVVKGLYLYNKAADAYFG